MGCAYKATRVVSSLRQIAIASRNWNSVAVESSEASGEENNEVTADNQPSSSLTEVV